MPWATFIKGDVAFHEGSLVKYSHGCIHLRQADAIKAFCHLKNLDRVDLKKSTAPRQADPEPI
jgi:hypothetical protein